MYDRSVATAPACYCEPTEGWRGNPRLLRTREALTGQIDVFRCENSGLLGVWGYKPCAAAERSADIRVFLCAVMLALRTGLPMSAFLCGYFDEKDA